MVEDEGMLERVKQLVDRNSRETRELFGRQGSASLQFPVVSGGVGSDSLGITPFYRNRGTGQTAKSKRPRSPVIPAGSLPDSNGAYVPPSVGPASAADGDLNSRPKVRKGNALGEKDAKGPSYVEKHQSPNDEAPSQLHHHNSRTESHALVPFTRSRQDAVSLAPENISASLAKDRPVWHPPWKMFRVISGHLGWVRSIAVDESNEWFVTGSADRTVKIWDLASGRLKLTLTGHISAVRGISISPRHPYMFTVGEDKTVKCWDLEQNKVIRNYHGHMSGVYCVSLHPTLDVLMTGGRDSTVRVWDVRTRGQIFVLGGHRDTVNAVVTQAVDPQIISASVDSTIRFWDLAAGKCSATLTNHKKGVRALARNPREFSFASASADNIKTWALPRGEFMRNLNGVHQEKLVNALAVNEDGVLVSGGDDGSVGFWDYGSAHCFQKQQTIVQPGSLDCEAGVFALTFDKSGSRLITCETDKTIKMWKEDENATPETHPLNWKPDLQRKRY